MREPDSHGPKEGGGLDGPGSCTLYPEETAGPFYIDLDLLRRDITEGKPGAALALMVQVVRASGCAPIKDAAVDVWHCDVGGIYSGYPGMLGGVDTTGQKFLRGTQVTGDDGRVQFDTIYPGWYPGRTTHIHFMVHLSASSRVVSQMYFPDDVTAEVYKLAPYAMRGPKDTPNAADGVAGAKLPPLLAVAKSGASYVGTLVVTVAG